MLDPGRQAELEQYLRQFCNDALRESSIAAEAAVAETALVVRSVLADAAQRWNATLPVAKIPPTPMTEVFKYLSLQDRMHVTRVCRSWRLVALSEAGLWTRVALKSRPYNPLYDADVIPWCNSDFMRSVLHRSAGELLDLRVYELLSGPYAEAFFNALPDIIGRLRSLHVEFIMSFFDLERFMDVLSLPAPCLEHLVLKNDGDGGKHCRGILPPFCAPRLRSLCLTGAALSSSLEPFPLVSKLTVGPDVSRVTATSWTQHLFTLFPNAVEVHIPNFGGGADFPAAPRASHRIQSLTIGHDRPSNAQRYLPPYHLDQIPLVRLHWSSHKTAKALLGTFGAASPRALSITGFGFSLALSDAHGAVRRECELFDKDLARVLAETALFATVTHVTLTDRCAPDPVWKLVAALPAITELTILVAESGTKRLLTRDDSLGRAAQATRHPTLETVILKDDAEWYATADVPSARYRPTVFAVQAERVLRAWVGITVSHDGSSSPRVVSRGVLIAGAAQSALKIITEAG